MAMLGRLAFLCVLSLVLSTSAVCTGGSTEASAQVEAKKLDIQGFRTGMSGTELVDLLKSKGFKGINVPEQRGCQGYRPPVNGPPLKTIECGPIKVQVTHCIGNWIADSSDQNLVADPSNPPLVLLSQKVAVDCHWESVN
jgi:hypothetical protein